VDEICFFGVDEETKIKSHTELIRAVKPGLATVQGKLVCISSPYAKKGWSYQQFQRHHGNNEAKTLVVNCPSRTLNPTLPQRIVDEAMEEDRASALAEYYGQFRDDIVDYITREMVEAVVVPGRTELPPDRTSKYYVFTDVSGGRSDDAALAIGHREGRNVVLDLLRRYQPPHRPYAVIGEMCQEIRRYDINKVVGDNYAAEFVAGAFKEQGFKYEKCEFNKSALYLEMLPRITSHEVELLDNDFMVNQIANLERRTRSGGKDSVDHPHGGHDDVANVVAGVIASAATKRIRIGALSRGENSRSLVGC